MCHPLRQVPLLQHANKAIDEERRVEFFRKGARIRGVVKGKRWLLLTRWVHLTVDQRQQLNHLFALKRKVMKAYLLKESGAAVDVYLRGRDVALPEELE